MNFRSQADKQAKLAKYNALIKQGVENQKRLQQATLSRVESENLGITPQATPQYKSTQDELQDEAQLRNTALSHLREIMPRGQDALTALQRYMESISRC
jgi:uncharacterized iron-regulated protein